MTRWVLVLLGCLGIWGAWRAATPGESLAVGEGPVSVGIPPGYFLFNAGFSPKSLGRHTPTPVQIEVTGEVKTFEEGPPVLGIEALEIDLDGNIVLNAEGLPKCNPLYESRAACRPALIGRGTADYLVATPNPAEPAPVTASVSLYSGGVRGDGVVIYAEARLPAPYSQVLVRAIHLYPEPFRKGPFASTASFAFPRVEGVEARLVSFDLETERTISVDGRSVPVFEATCPVGKLQVHAVARLSGGELMSSEVIRSCTPRR